MNLRRLKRRHDARAMRRWRDLVVGYWPDDDEEDYSDGLCPRCDGDGRDRYTDYLLPCPMCQGEQTT